MMRKVKYIKTANKEIIVFSELQNHSEFKSYSPVSAGFISIGISTANKYAETTCTCYGESVSLGLKSDEEDTNLANKQILGNGY